MSPTRASALDEVAEGVWLASEPVSIVGMPLSVNMTVLRLDSDALVVHSPLEATPALVEEVAALGRVRHLYAPNTFHHRRLAEWQAAYPDATLHAPRGLFGKRDDLRIDRLFDAPPPGEWANQLDEVEIAGFRLEEAVLFHRPSGTLVVTDLFHNVGRPSSRWARIYTRLMGFYDRVALSRVIRSTAFTDEAAAREAVSHIAAWPVERIVVGHGAPIVEGAREAFDGAVAWLLDEG